jgi:hypothetical protein
MWQATRVQQTVQGQTIVLNGWAVSAGWSGLFFKHRCIWVRACCARQQMLFMRGLGCASGRNLAAATAARRRCPGSIGREAVSFRIRQAGGTI